MLLKGSPRDLPRISQPSAVRRASPRLVGTHRLPFRSAASDAATVDGGNPRSRRKNLVPPFGSSTSFVWLLAHTLPRESTNNASQSSAGTLHCGNDVTVWPSSLQS